MDACVGDLAIHTSFVAGLSPQSSYARLLSSRKPDGEELRRWTDIDHADEEALVAIASEGGSDREVGPGPPADAAGVPVPAVGTCG